MATIHPMDSKRLDLNLLVSTQLETLMAHGDIDLALMRPEDAPSSLRSRHMRYVLIGRRNHPRLRRGLALEDFVALEQCDCFAARRRLRNSSGRGAGCPGV